MDLNDVVNFYSVHYARLPKRFFESLVKELALHPVVVQEAALQHARPGLRRRLRTALVALRSK